LALWPRRVRPRRTSLAVARHPNLTRGVSAVSGWVSASTSDLSCKRCPGGAEVELTMLFADLRGCTAMAEHMPAEAFAKTLNQFYTSATDVLIQTDAYIDKLVADEVVGLYFPLFAEKGHARRAVEAAGKLLLAAGYVNPSGPLFSVGIGVQKGTAFAGTVAGAEDGHRHCGAGS
jgi:adenylate cyclase